MKKNKTLVIILTIIMFCSLILYTRSYALEGIEEAMEGVASADPGQATKVTDILNTVIGLFQIAGTGIALIVITMLGIKYMMAAPSEKADVKKQIMPIIIGCILVFGGLNIMVAVYDFANNVLTE